MISSIPVNVGDDVQLMKFSTAAMVRLEELNPDGKSIFQILADMEQGVTAKSVVQIIGATMNDGEGVSHAEALSIVDTMGGPIGALAELNRAAKAAFPGAEPDAGDSGKKPKKKAPVSRRRKKAQSA